MTRLPFVHEYYDRHGKVRRYFRKRGTKQVALPGRPGSPEFLKAYQAIVSGETPPPVQRGAAKPGTFAALVRSYYAAADFTNLKPRSKSLYKIILEPMIREHGHRLAGDLTRAKARELISKIATERGPGRANVTISVLKKLMNFAIDAGLRTDNPFKGIKEYKGGSHHTWTEAELTIFEARWPVGTRERLVYDLLLYTGQRIGDVCRMTRANIVNGRVVLTQEKNGSKISIPIHPNLERSLSAAPANGLAIVAQRNGRPVERKTIREVLGRAVAAAGLPEHCVPHGLRKALLRRLTERGATTKQIMSVSGHKTLAMVELYTAEADQSVLSDSAVALLHEPKREQSG